MAVHGTAIHNLTLRPAGLVSAGHQPSLAVAANLLYADTSSQIKITSGNAIGKKKPVSETTHRRQHYFLTDGHNHIITSGARLQQDCYPELQYRADDGS